ncbi:hypothetical protein [Paenisporosarcina sp. TG20]|uniref:hypothetical protein n=1 Tax=Paenisporosarcina sp. TG20 TaxID=1211706 RepID=UPI0002D366AC|nr:hypothetical protein [Paenisporosarcina sp. TG20]
MTTVYRMFKKKHLLFDDRFTKTMCMAITMISSFAFALYLELLLPPEQRFFYILPILVGLIIGWRFSAIIKAPATLNGIYNGTLGGTMGMMLGAVLQDPALCNIPIVSETMIATNMYSLAIFTACLHALICHFIRYSFKA